MPREPASQAGYRGRRCSPPSPMQAIKTDRQTDRLSIIFSNESQYALAAHVRICAGG